MPGAYKTRRVTKLTGFSPALLRAWERRYRLLEPERTAGGHRLYTEADLRVLLRIKQLLAGGRTIGEVAHLGRASLLSEPALPGSGREPLSPHQPPAADLAGLAPTLSQLRADLVAATAALDAAAVAGLLDRAFALASPDLALGEVVEPALIEVGEAWEQGRVSVAGEHLLSAAVGARLGALLEGARARAAAGQRPVICACLPDELHQLGVQLVAWVLARAGRRVIYLGAALPLADLERACERLAPSEVYLSVSRAPHLAALAPALGDLARRRGGQSRLVLGGRGVTGPHPELAAAGVRLVYPAPRYEELSALLA